ncbi:unnamed protein product [Paramecium octaurelia]|uniref:Uncharacterized protein n=1 Tax=Paramecium octaurelia TaxID=43137 RepID=A0A8S1YP44_PAROT|nr:unnamed protein product [Paramecium octaurelia]CAD8215468.1 unnamed protein product [Paramecium octaurelia]
MLLELRIDLIQDSLRIKPEQTGYFLVKQLYKFQLLQLMVADSDILKQFIENIQKIASKRICNLRKGVSFQQGRRNFVESIKQINCPLEEQVAKMKFLVSSAEEDDTVSHHHSSKFQNFLLIIRKKPYSMTGLTRDRKHEIFIILQYIFDKALGSMYQKSELQCRIHQNDKSQNTSTFFPGSCCDIVCYRLDQELIKQLTACNVFMRQFLNDFLKEQKNAETNTVGSAI